jgi:exosortase H (IPTLxxWG-CTERM-specific)
MTRREKNDEHPPPSPSPRRQAVVFAVLFFAYLAAGNLLFFVPAVKAGAIEPWTRLNAAASAAIASAFGVESHADGTEVSSGAARLDVKQGCNGVHALLILLSSILAFPAPWSRRLIGVVAGTVALLGINLLRVVNLIVVARYFPDRLELFHIAIWQTLIVLVAVMLFLAWGMLIASRRPPSIAADRA